MSKYNFEQKRNDYMSPVELVNIALENKNRDFFDLDVCASKENIPALNHYIDGIKDGLKEHWHSLNWCNPPFDECAKWIKKHMKSSRREMKQ